MDLKVTYEGFDKALDELITEAMITVGGLRWLSQDFDQLTKKREICFEYEKKE